MPSERTQLERIRRRIDPKTGGAQPPANMQLAHNGRSGFEISGKETPPGAKKIETLPVLQGNKVKPAPARDKMQRTTQHELAT